MFFHINADGVFTLSEGAGLAGLGLKPGEVVGKSALEVYKHNPDIVRNVQRALSNEAFVAASESNGRVFETHYSPDRKGGTIGVAVNMIPLVKRATAGIKRMTDLPVPGCLMGPSAYIRAV